MATYTLIEAKTLSASAASVTFSSIPATYTDLVVRMSTRSDAVTANMSITINSFTSGYSQTYMYGSGTSAASGRITGAASFTPIAINASSHTANTFASTEIYIPSYTASQNKPISLYSVIEVDSATTNYIFPEAELLSQTAAISSITFAGSTGNMVTGSSFYLYGISNA